MIQLNRNFEKAVIDIIEEGYADGTFRDIGPPRVVAFGIIGMMNWTNRWFKPGSSKISGEEIGAVFARMASLGLSSSKGRSSE
jgi:hypothetical protein